MSYRQSQSPLHIGIGCGVILAVVLVRVRHYSVHDPHGQDGVSMMDFHLDKKKKLTGTARNFRACVNTIVTLITKAVSSIIIILLYDYRH